MLPSCSIEQRNSTGNIIHFTKVHRPRNISEEGGTVKNLLEVCCGLDVHKEVLVACMLKGRVDEDPEPVTKEFGPVKVFL